MNPWQRFPLVFFPDSVARELTTRLVGASR